MNVVSVTEFLSIANEVLYPMRDLAVEGEVSGFQIRQNTYAFFKIKDNESALDCFILAFRLNVTIEDGMKIRVYGTPGFYKNSGKFRFNVAKIEPVGEGILKKSLEALRKKLELEGLFDESRKRELPRFSEKIGFIGSVESAAYTDFIRILNNRWQGVEVRVFDVRVQGEDSANDIQRAFQYFNSVEDKPDVLVLTRGGGSFEDLMSFNDERVARAVYSSKIPVVCGVGHEKDESLADFVADVRASTPSNAAEIIFRDRREIHEQLIFLQDNLSQKIENVIREKSHNIERFFNLMTKTFDLTSEKTRFVIDNFLQNSLFIIRATKERFVKVENLFLSLKKHLNTKIVQQKTKLDTLERLLSNLNPNAVLSRGFSIIYDSKGKIVKESKSVSSGDDVMLQFAKGTHDAVIK